MLILYVYMFSICSCHVVLKVYLLTYLLTYVNHLLLTADLQLVIGHLHYNAL